MGYACPVCEVEQPDGEHLAHHLAFTAMLHGGEHEAWLDEHAAGWGDCGPAELADVVTERAPEADVRGVTEAEGDDLGTVGSSSPRRAATPERDRRPAAGGGARNGEDALDGEAAAVLQEARALTRTMLDESDAEGGETEDGTEREADHDEE